MPTSPSTRLALVGPAGTDTIAQGDDQIRAIITQLEAVGAGFEQGTSRPAAAAALAGYFYINTSTGLVSYCTGSVWLDFQAHDSDLDSIAALSTTSYGRSLLAAADASALRTLAGLGSLATLSAIGSAQITDGAIATADIGDGQITAAKLSAQESWNAATMLNGWTGTVSYMKDHLGVVHLKDTSNYGTFSATALTLPAGYRPTASRKLPAADPSAVGGVMVTIGTDGTVSAVKFGGGAPVSVDFTAVSFPTF